MDVWLQRGANDKIAGLPFWTFGCIGVSIVKKRFKTNVVLQECAPHLCDRRIEKVLFYDSARPTCAIGGLRKCCFTRVRAPLVR